MTPTHIEHIGIAVRDLATAIPLYEKLLGTSCYAVEVVADQQVRTALFRVGETKIELLESTAPDGPVGKFIEKHGEGVHHIAFAVNGLEKVLAALDAEGVPLIDRKPRAGAEGLSIAFLHPKYTHGVLTELCEPPERK